MNETNHEAEKLVRLLLDEQGQQVEVEYRTTSIDSMPHIIWMLRALGGNGGDTSYLATGTGHNQEDAERQVAEQARILGVTVVRASNGSSNPAQPGS